MYVTHPLFTIIISIVYLHLRFFSILLKLKKFDLDVQIWKNAIFNKIIFVLIRYQ